MTQNSLTLNPHAYQMDASKGFRMDMTELFERSGDAAAFNKAEKSRKVVSWGLYFTGFFLAGLGVGYGGTAILGSFFTGNNEDVFLGFMVAFTLVVFVSIPLIVFAHENSKRVSVMRDNLLNLQRYETFIVWAEQRYGLSFTPTEFDDFVAHKFVELGDVQGTKVFLEEKEFSRMFIAFENGKEYPLMPNLT